MSCVAQAETPLLLCIIITITLIVYTKENHATIAPPPQLFGPHNAATCTETELRLNTQ